MTAKVKAAITVAVQVNVTVSEAWKQFTEPKHITQWYAASEDWHAPRAENDLRAGGKFLTRMAAKDGSFGFDFSGKYDKIEPLKLIEYTLDDDRKVRISFESDGKKTRITETFETEQTNTAELQQKGWQAILNNFKKYAEKK
jgi:uncharacterized protein YndB with AHSA1/START domain